MFNPFKKKLLILSLFLGIASATLVSCGEQNVEETPKVEEPIQDDNNDDNTDIEVNENEDLTVPEQTSVTQIYLKRALTNLTMGQTLDLTNYIGILPGTNDNQSSTSFSASILTTEASDDCASIAGNTLSLYRAGTVKLAIVANKQYRVFTLEVQESVLFTRLLTYLEDIDDNYTAEFITTDSLGAEIVQSKVFRGTNYIYSNEVGYGYLLSKKDYNTYLFTLSDEDSDDLNVTTPPAGDLSLYNGTFYDLNRFAVSSYWRYTESFSSEAQYQGYNYMMDISTEEAGNFFTSLFLSTYMYDSTNAVYVYPYRVYARVTTSEIRFMPVYANTEGTYTVITYPVRLVDIGTTEVSVLKTYIDEADGPDRVDTTEIINNFKYLSETLNYTWDTDLTVYREDGSVLSANSSIYSSFFARFGNPLCEKKATPTSYWSERYTSYDGGLVPGGLFSYDGVTYRYNNYYGTTEATDYTLDGPYQVYSSSYVLLSYANWYSYSTVRDYLFDSCFDYGDIFNSYPTINDDGDYVFDGKSDESLAFVTDMLAFTVQSYAARYGILTSALTRMENIEMVLGFEYDANGDLEEINITIRLTYDCTLETSLSENYTMQYVSRVYDIEETDLHDIEVHLISLME